MARLPGASEVHVEQRCKLKINGKALQDESLYSAWRLRALQKVPE